MLVVDAFDMLADVFDDWRRSIKKFFKNIGLENVGKFFGFQEGGFVTRPTLAAIGERAPEFVFTQEQAVALAGLGVNTTGGGRGGGTTNINIDGGIWVQDMDEFVNMIGRKLNLIRG